MRQSAVLADEYVLGPNELEAEIQELREQNHKLRLAMEQAARLIWIKPTEAEKMLSTALK
jgi:hypothetical protein